MGNLGGNSAPAQCPSPQRSHIGPGPGLVDEDQPFCLDETLIFCLLRSPPRDLGSTALASRHAFLKLSF